MDYEALVRAITERVLAELCPERACAPKACAAGPRVLVLAAPDSAGAVELQSWLRGLFGHGALLHFFTGTESELPFDHYILPSLCCADMAALASGRATGPITRKVLELLLSGEKVAVLDFAYTRQAAKAPAPLYRLYADYEKTLASFGLTKFVADSAAKNSTDAAPATFLVTEKSVRDAAERGLVTLKVPAKGIVTALAWDVARELGVHISKDGGI